MFVSELSQQVENLKKIITNVQAGLKETEKNLAGPSVKN